MITVYVKHDCGCCTTEMQFESEESATAAFQKAGFGNGMEVVDDVGVKHTGIDTFYGFSVKEDEQRQKSLGYLASLVARKQKNGV